MSSFYHQLTPGELERLAILIEEASEVQQIACKVLRHGYESCHPLKEDFVTNRNYLEKEMGHLINAVNMIIKHDVDGENVESSAQQKAATIGRYLHHQG